MSFSSLINQLKNGSRRQGTDEGALNFLYWLSILGLVFAGVFGFSWGCQTNFVTGLMGFVL